MSDHVIRPLQSRAELLACVQLQRETWGESFVEVVPPAILWASQQVGGVAAGAFDGDGRLDGFVFGISGVRDGRLAHWSDMLAVRPSLRGRGLGLALKRYQRDALLPLGVETVYWTFDPLEARNAHVNFVHLGVTARSYLRDAYGESAATLHAGIGTDRLVAEWRLRDSRVVQRLAGGTHAASHTFAEAPLVNASQTAEPDASALRLDLDAPRVRIAVPADIQALKAAAPERARAWRTQTRAAFEAYLARGYVVEDFVRGEAGGCYLLALTALES